MRSSRSPKSNKTHLVQQVLRHILDGIRPKVTKQQYDLIAPHVDLSLPPEHVLDEKISIQTSACLTANAYLHREPMELATALKQSLCRRKIIQSVHIQEPGFLNIELTPKAWQDVIAHVIEEGSHYGRLNLGQDRPVALSYGAPPHPLTVPDIPTTRRAIYGDVLARLLTFTNHKVTRTYNAAHNFTSLTQESRIRFVREVHDLYQQMLGKRPQIQPQTGLAHTVALHLLRREGSLLLFKSDFQPTLFYYHARNILQSITHQLWNRMGILFDKHLFVEPSSQEHLEETLQELREQGLAFVSNSSSQKEKTFLKIPEMPEILIHEDNTEPVWSDLLQQLSHLLQIDHDQGSHQIHIIPDLESDTRETIIKTMEHLTHGKARVELLPVRDTTIAVTKGYESPHLFLHHLLDLDSPNISPEVLRLTLFSRRPDRELVFDLPALLYPRTRIAIEPNTEILKKIHKAYHLFKISKISKISKITPLRTPKEYQLAQRIAFWPHVVFHASQKREPFEILLYVRNLTDQILDTPTKNRSLQKAAHIVLDNGMGILGLKDLGTLPSRHYPHPQHHPQHHPQQENESPSPKDGDPPSDGPGPNEPPPR